MTVEELIKSLQQVDPNARIFMGYDGNVVVEESGEVFPVNVEDDIQDGWCSVKVGDVVILSA